MLIHLLISVPRNDYLNEDMPDDEGIQGMPDDVGIPDLAADFPGKDIPACPIPSKPSRFPQQSASSGQTVVLRADRFHRHNIQNPKTKQRCMGIKPITFLSTDSCMVLQQAHALPVWRWQRYERICCARMYSDSTGLCW
jgi:hypothetical protein